MSDEHFVVIGNGPAGNAAALTLREKAPDARITLIGKERKGGYRPHLLPDYIGGKISEDALFICSRSEYKDRDIKLRNGQQVVDIDLHEKALTFEHKEILRFSGLIIAVGGRPRIPEHLFAFNELLFTLKTLDDARDWIDNLSRVDSVFIVGGDLTSLAFTRVLLQLNKTVFFMLNEDCFWPLRCNQGLLDAVAQRLARKGVAVIISQKLGSIARITERVYQIWVGDQEIKVGMIGAFFGLVPDIQFLAGTGLRIDRGVLVDEYLATGFKDVYATGDCAQIYHPEIRDYWVSIGHDNAVNLGRIAALNLVGGRVRADVAKESIFDSRGIKVNTSWWTDF